MSERRESTKRKQESENEKIFRFHIFLLSPSDFRFRVSTL